MSSDLDREAVERVEERFDAGDLLDPNDIAKEYVLDHDALRRVIAIARRAEPTEGLQALLDKSEHERRTLVLMLAGCIKKVKELERENERLQIIASTGRLTKGEYVTAGRPDGWEWIERNADGHLIRMWCRHCQCFYDAALSAGGSEGGEP